MNRRKRKLYFAFRVIVWVITTVAAAHLVNAQSTVFWDIDAAARRATRPNTIPRNRDANSVYSTIFNLTTAGAFSPAAIPNARAILRGRTISLTNGSGTVFINVPPGISRIILWRVASTNSSVTRGATSDLLFGPDRRSGSALAGSTAPASTPFTSLLSANAGASDAAIGPFTLNTDAGVAPESGLDRLQRLVNGGSGSGFRTFVPRPAQPTFMTDALTIRGEAGTTWKLSFLQDASQSSPDLPATVNVETIYDGSTAMALAAAAPGSQTLKISSSTDGTAIVIGTLAVKSAAGGNGKGNGNGNGNGNTNGQNTITINNGQTYTGTGTVSATFIVNSGGTLSPGGPPGSLRTLDQTWKGGAKLVIEVRDATAGAGVGWDFLNINGRLNVSASAGKPVTIDLRSLTLGGTAGNVYNFSNTLSYTWQILSASGGIILPAGETLSTAFSLNTAGFSNPLNGGTFSLVLANNNRDLMLSFTPALIPEPDPKYMVAFGFLLFFARPRKHPPTYRFRRQQPQREPDAPETRNALRAEPGMQGRPECLPRDISGLHSAGTERSRSRDPLGC